MWTTQSGVVSFEMCFVFVFFFCAFVETSRVNECINKVWRMAKYGRVKCVFVIITAPILSMPQGPTAQHGMHYSIFVSSKSKSASDVLWRETVSLEIPGEQWKSLRGRLHAQRRTGWKRHAFRQIAQHIFNTSVERWWWWCRRRRRRRRATNSLALAFGTKLFSVSRIRAENLYCEWHRCKNANCRLIVLRRRTNETKAIGE